MLAIPGVSEVAVNLLGNSATALVTEERTAAQTVEAIEEVGYEAHIMSLDPILASGQVSETDNTERTIALRVDGMYCQ